MSFVEKGRNCLLFDVQCRLVNSDGELNSIAR